MATTSKAKKLTPAQLDEVCDLFGVLADTSRLRILHSLMENSQTVGELVENLELGQANVSKHLAQLHRVGLISREKEGNKVRYAISSPLTQKLCDLVCDSVTEKAVLRLKQLAGKQ